MPTSAASAKRHYVRRGTRRKSPPSFSSSKLPIRSRVGAIRFVVSRTVVGPHVFGLADPGGTDGMVPRSGLETAAGPTWLPRLLDKARHCAGAPSERLSTGTATVIMISSTSRCSRFCARRCDGVGPRDGACAGCRCGALADRTQRTERGRSHGIQHRVQAEELRLRVGRIG